MRVFLVAGARPNFMKIAPIYQASLNHNQIDCRVVHTGQHYDHEMSQAFLDDLDENGILNAYWSSLEKVKQAKVPPLWDGMAAERIWRIILNADD